MRQLKDFRGILFWEEEVWISRGFLKTIFMPKSSKQFRQHSKPLAAECQEKSLSERNPSWERNPRDGIGGIEKSREVPFKIPANNFLYGIFLRTTYLLMLRPLFLSVVWVLSIPAQCSSHFQEGWIFTGKLIFSCDVGILCQQVLAMGQMWISNPSQTVSNPRVWADYLPAIFQRLAIARLVIFTEEILLMCVVRGWFCYNFLVCKL